MKDSNVYLKPVGFVREAERRRVERTLRSQEQAAAREERDLDRQLRTLRSEYRSQLTELMGRGNMRRYRQLRSELADAGRTKRIREARKFLDTIGFDRARGDRIRAAYLREAQKLRDLHPVIAPPTRRLPLDECSPWVTYMAPYHGWSWAFAWSRSDEPDDPVLARYLDSGTGHIGSSISVRVSGADDDDSLQADYHTALNVWHTTLATGVLEAYLAFEVNATPYSGKVTDEFGFSNATFQQWAGARLRVADTQGAFEMQETQILNSIDTAWGDDKDWDRVAFKARDRHWFFFRTNVGFLQGSAILVEAGIFNTTWFTCDDQSIRMADDVDLRLERIMVRTCPGPIIL